MQQNKRKFLLFQMTILYLKRGVKQGGENEVQYPGKH